MNNIDEIDPTLCDALDRSRLVSSFAPEHSARLDAIECAIDADLGKLSLSLLKVFLALATEGSVTGASQKLGLAQSTVSHALARLRTALGDPLFVRSTRGIQPTAMALNLIEPFARALKLVQEALAFRGGFDPASSTRSFNLLMTDAGEMLFAPRLVASLRHFAPNIKLSIRQLPRDAYKEALEIGVADLAIGQLPNGRPDLLQQTLSSEPFEGFARKGHSILTNTSLDAFLAADHLVVGPPAMAELHVQRALGNLSSRRRISLQVQHYLPAGFILAKTDLVAVMPRTIGEFLSSLDSVSRFTPPVEIEPVIMHQFWHARSTRDEGCRWLRAQVLGLFRGLVPHDRAETVSLSKIGVDVI